MAKQADNDESPRRRQVELRIAERLYRAGSQLRAKIRGGSHRDFVQPGVFYPGGGTTAEGLIRLLRPGQDQGEAAAEALRCPSLVRFTVGVFEHANWREYKQPSESRSFVVQRVRRTMLEEHRLHVLEEIGVPRSTVQIYEPDPNVAVMVVYRPLLTAQAGRADVNPQDGAIYRRVVRLAEERTFVVNLAELRNLIVADGLQHEAGYDDVIPRGPAVKTMIEAAISEGDSTLVFPVATSLTLEQRYNKQ